jgi:hypothetical protein
VSVKETFVFLFGFLLFSLIFSLYFLNKIKQIENFFQIQPILFIDYLYFFSSLFPFIQVLHYILHLANLIIGQLLSLLQVQILGLDSL